MTAPTPPGSSSPPPNASIVGVQFRPAGVVGEYDSGGIALTRGDRVVVESQRALALGTVARPPVAGVVADPAPKVLRKADARDFARDEQNQVRQQEAHRVCLTRIRERGLAMKLVGVEYQFDGAKAVFYFCAEGRIDFRELVRDLAHALHTRIEMKQIGARDETKMLGGVGPCGRELCCSTWLREFQAVSVRMAKEQGLSLNPSKLSGMCGRLKCCLRYEYDTYLQLRRGLPKIGARVTSVKGDGEVQRHNVLKQTAIVRRDDDGTEVEVTLEDLVEKRAD
jgi:cell fate regulator YaaT (PSP1 superfamily)